MSDRDFIRAIPVRSGDKLFVRILELLAAVIILLTVGLAIITLHGGIEAFREFGLTGFIGGKIWDPGVSKQFGALPFLVGTAVTSLGALIIAFFPAVATAVFIS